MSILPATWWNSSSRPRPGDLKPPRGGKDVAQPVLSHDLGAAGGQLEPGISGSFTFKAGDKSLTKKLELEAMYNYFAAELSGPADPLLSLLRGKGDVTVSADKYGAATFPLKGSGAAIGKVLAECGKGSGGEAD
ncbi:hypothetical protein [Mesorhizobium sp.]|uniref:hypothetical protein n=1 Tax=Mesorhizobium sp. TaxID=1871066 RepID=UPI0025BE78C8|nr:hypothetical protein [Mesorhizobium sp.]